MPPATHAARTARVAETVAAPADPLWYKDAVIYQLHVRSFFDSDNDGIGDFVGLTQKLDYLQDLGVTALWLLPFYPSPLRDDGYDIADYMNVNPSYGTLRDFKNFVREAHARGLRVITEMVLNHTSDQHPWFQKARRAAPGSVAREFYVWNDSPKKYEDARIIFKDFESSNWAWDPIAQAYYWHRFYAHQPDLNFESPHVHKAMFEILDYWLAMGVDGVRLDAVPYLFEREGTNCENLPETHEFLKKLRKHVDDNFSDRMMLAEANQWPEDAIAYFGDGDECQTAFHFPVMPRLFMAIHSEDRFPILDILQQTPPIPDTCQWLVFLRNHDELTLEMVTDEERDYMWRVYAHDTQARINLGIRRRLAPLLGNDRRRIELMNGLLFSLAGTPVIYYGDEIGMGDNIYLGDRDGVRTPMQWNPDRNAGFSGANTQQLYSPVIIDSEYLYEAVNVEVQQKNIHSLLWWMKRLIALRQRYPALGRGTFEALAPENQKVLAFLRVYEGQYFLVVANLSRFVQSVELDLSAYASLRPVEAFGRTKMAPIGKTPYMLTLSPHAFYWFSLESDASQATRAVAGDLHPRLTVAEHWEEILRGRLKKNFESALVRDLPHRRWFAGKSRPIQSVQIAEVVPLDKSPEAGGAVLVFVRVEYLEGEPEGYSLVLSAYWDQAAERLLAEHPQAVLAKVQNRSTEQNGVVYDALDEPTAGHRLLDLVEHRRHLKGPRGELVGRAENRLTDVVGGEREPLPVAPNKTDQSNSSLVFGDKLILKIFRRVERGLSPELEMGRVLGVDDSFPHTPRLLGSLEYELASRESVTLGVLHQFVPQTVTAWRFTQDFLGRYLEQVLTAAPEQRPPQAVAGVDGSLWKLAQGDASAAAREHVGGYLESAALLGRRTGELHVALAKAPAADFTPEPFTQLYQRSLYQAAREIVSQAFSVLRREAKSFTGEAQQLATQLSGREKELLDRFRGISRQKLRAKRIRCHGDYHLGQLLWTGKDFLAIDFEGEPHRHLAARRIKRSPLQDVAGMIRSFHYAAVIAVQRLPQRGINVSDTHAVGQQAADFWRIWSSSAFLKSYAAAVADADLLPEDPAHVEALFQFHLLDRAVYELGYELNNRPEQSEVPLRGLTELLATLDTHQEPRTK